MLAVLFIDIDGVLHPPRAVIVGMDGKVHGDEAFCWLQPLLQLLCEWPDLQVVVHSTWRFHWETDAELRARLPAALASRVVCATPRDFPGRHESILAYCEQHDIEQFVILEDEPSAFPTGLPQLIDCSRGGLSNPETVKALSAALRCWK
jgi:hypothetical protein